MKYTASATEQEIDLGALKVSDAKKHVFGLFRSIDNLKYLEADLPKDEEKSGMTPRAKDFIDTLYDQVTHHAIHDMKAHENLEALEERGYHYGPIKDDKQKTRPALVPFAELPEHLKRSNRLNVRDIPCKLASVGLCWPLGISAQN